VLEVLKIERKRNFVSLPDLNQAGGRTKELRTLYIITHSRKMRIKPKNKGAGMRYILCHFTLRSYIFNFHELKTKFIKCNS
jgi:hypothetical protein